MSKGRLHRQQVDQKTYQRYSGHRVVRRRTSHGSSEASTRRVLELAVQRMMPKNTIGRHMLGKLSWSSATTHDHQAQNPIPLAPLSGRPTRRPAPLEHPPMPPKPKVEKPEPVPLLRMTVARSSRPRPRRPGITPPAEPNGLSQPRNTSRFPRIGSNRTCPTATVKPTSGGTGRRKNRGRSGPRP